MSYEERINEVLRPKSDSDWVVLDLFAGCGGLSLGFEAAGFQTVGYEVEKRYAETYTKNLNGTCHEQRLTSATNFEQSYDIIIGGPPCQPFSVGGNQRGINDERNGFPAFINAIKKSSLNYGYLRMSVGCCTPTNGIWMKSLTNCKAKDISLIINCLTP